MYFTGWAGDWDRIRNFVFCTLLIYVALLVGEAFNRAAPLVAVPVGWIFMVISWTIMSLFLVTTRGVVGGTTTYEVGVCMFFPFMYFFGYGATTIAPNGWSWFPINHVFGAVSIPLLYMISVLLYILVTSEFKIGKMIRSWAERKNQQSSQ